MTINHKIWNFPTLKIESQLFHVPGSYFDGGLTSGGARIMSPEPGGRSVLEMRLAYQVKEWEAPFSSWLMSKINGAIFKVQLTKTPQIASFIGESNYNLRSTGVSWDNDQIWDNDQPWVNDGANLGAVGTALEGAVELSVSVGSFGEILKHGHVIGIGNHSYIIDDVSYVGTRADLVVSPPLRTNVANSEPVWLKPYFLGVIANGPEIRNSYDAGNIGGIQLNRIVFNEVVI